MKHITRGCVGVVATFCFLCSGFGPAGRAQGTFYLTFSEPTNAVAAGVAHYEVWWRATNELNPNCHAWLAQCPAGRTNIDLPAGQMPNPVWLFASATSTSGVQSAFSEGLLFNTNNFPLPARVTAPGRLIIHRRK